MISVLKTALQTLLQCLLSLGIILYSSPALAQVATPAAVQLDPAVASKVDTARQALVRARAAIPAKTSNLVAAAEALDFDVETAIAYVRDDIAHVPYAGSMRGDVGAMAAGSASALDQALLLGGLLDLMGVDVVIARGTLSAADADRLIEQATKVRAPDAVDLGDALPAPDAASRNAVSAFDLGRDIGPALDAGTRTLSAKLSPFLGATPKAADPLADVRDDLRKHYSWIRYRDRQSDPWVDVHPAFGGQKAPKVAPVSFSDIAVPADRQHRFGFQLSLETSEQGRTNRTPLVTMEPEAVSQLAGRQPVLEVAPLGLDATDPTTGQPADYFLPLVDGQTLPGARGFSATGRTVAASTLTSASSGAEAASVFDGALSALGTDADKAGPRPTGLWLTTTYESPLGTQTRERLIRAFTKDDGTPRDTPLRALDALVRVVFDINTGQTDGARVLDQQLAAMDSQLLHLPWQFGVASGTIPQADYEANVDVMATAPTSAWAAMAFAQGAFLPARFDGGTVVPLTALISTSRVFIDPVDAPGSGAGEASGEGKLTLITDLMHTDALVLDARGRVDREARMKLGVRQTLMEAAITTGQVENGKLTRSDAAWQVVDSPAKLKAAARTLDAPTRARMAADLDRAGHLLVPRDPGDAPQWWALDRQSGAILGMGVHGGQATEYGVVTRITANGALSAVLLGASLIACGFHAYFDSTQSFGKFAGCVGVSIALFSLGFGAGVLLAETAIAVEALAAATIAMEVAATIISMQLPSQ